MALDAMAERYEAQGFLTQVDVFSEREIGQFRRSFDALEAREGKEKCQIGLHIAPKTKSPSSSRTRARVFFSRPSLPFPLRQDLFPRIQFDKGLDRREVGHV